MSIKKFYQYNEEEITEATMSIVEGITNPGAMHTIRQVMFIKPNNETFTEEEISFLEVFLEII